MNLKAVTILKYLSFLFVFLPAACVYDNEFTYINDQIIALNNRVQRLQESMDEKIESGIEAGIETSIDKKVDSQIKTINANQAEATVEMDQLRTDLKELEGRVEDNEYYIKSTHEKDLMEQDAVREDLGKISDLVKRVENLEETVKQQNRFMGLEGTEAGKADQTEDKSTPALTKTSSEEGKLTESEIYANSLNLYRMENYEQAIRNRNWRIMPSSGLVKALWP